MRSYDFLKWMLPESLLTQVLSTIGLSFLFFKIVHIMIEARSGTLGQLHFLTYLGYCLNFVTFMMGPIQRYQDFYRQWHGIEQAIPSQFEAHLDALLRVLIGLVKAYVLADRLEVLALRPDTDVLGLPFLDLLVQVYAFYFFLYLNFSGYCDVVIGVGSLLGLKPPENFNLPFLSRNIADFWLRQHRTLTLWLTDYVFSPLYKWTLGRPRLASSPLLAANIALLITMLVSGLWHGTTVNFLFFGLTHGIFLIVYRIWDALLIRWFGRQAVKAWRQKWQVQFVGMILTFNAVAFAFIFFRLDTIQITQLLAHLGDL
jgi:D-alanyl-lipoteichoic acid acyltransferase DltB (MBOAT superfamily)